MKPPNPPKEKPFAQKEQLRNKPTQPQTNKLFVILNSLHDDPRNPGAFWHLTQGLIRLRFWSQFSLSSKLHQSFSDSFYLLFQALLQ